MIDSPPKSSYAQTLSAKGACSPRKGPCPPATQFRRPRPFFQPARVRTPGPLKGASYVPNPQDALPLPPRPSLDQYKKRAKDLLKASQSPAPAAIRAWAAEWIASPVRLSNLNITPQLPVRIDHWTDELESFARGKLSETGTLTSDYSPRIVSS
jgi:hypothetical protein